jgi:hypothetical protein
MVLLAVPANLIIRAIVPATKKVDQMNAFTVEAINMAIRRKETKNDTNPPYKMLAQIFSDSIDKSYLKMQ